MSNDFDAYGGGGQQYQGGHVEPHRGTVLIVFAILGWFVCPIFSVVAWVMARADLEKIRAGQMDPAGEGLTNAAKIVSIIAIVLNVLAIVGMCLLFGVGLATAANEGGANLPVEIGEETVFGEEITSPAMDMPVGDPGDVPHRLLGPGPKGATGAVAETPAAADPEATVEDPYRRVLGLASQNPDGALLLARTILTDEKKTGELSDAQLRNLLLLTTRLAQSVGIRKARSGDVEGGHQLFRQSAGHYRSLKDKFKPLTPNETQVGRHVFYNEACALSVAGENKVALAALQQSFQHGWDDLDHIGKDPDLDNLRKLPEFNQLLATQRSAVVERAKKSLARELATNTPFPFAFSLPDLDGKPLSLEGQKGKVVIVDIWGTWCPPCRAEIPHFVKLQERYGKDGLQIIGINYERGQNPIPGIKAFAKEFKINYPCVIGDPATRNQVPAFRGYPTTLFIDRSGVVRLKVVGLTPYERLEAIVTTLLAEPGPKTDTKAKTKAPPTKKKPAVKTSSVWRPGRYQMAA